MLATSPAGPQVPLRFLLLLVEERDSAPLPSSMVFSMAEAAVQEDGPGSLSEGKLGTSPWVWDSG